MRRFWPQTTTDILEATWASLHTSRPLPGYALDATRLGARPGGTRSR